MSTTRKICTYHVRLLVNGDGALRETHRIQAHFYEVDEGVITFCRVDEERHVSITATFAPGSWSTVIETTEDAPLEGLALVNGPATVPSDCKQY